MGARTWPGLIESLLSGAHLAAEDTAWAMRQIMAGDAAPSALAGFLVALRAKGETAEELTGLVDAVLAGAPEAPVGRDAVDIVGTGGDQAATVNISTMAALVVAGAGVPVVKHGGRSASSRSGSADVLEALGVPPDLPPSVVARCAERAGICYLFAPQWHAGLRHAASVRRELGVLTAINLIGPLVNPARPRAALVGCADSRLAPVLARVLAARRCSALVVRGDDGLDEISTASPTRVWTVDGGRVVAEVLDAAAFGFARCEPGDLAGGDAAHNAGVARRVLAGEGGPVRDAVLVNAAAAIACYRGVPGDLSRSVASGLREAERALASGAAAGVLARWAGVCADAM